MRTGYDLRALGVQSFDTGADKLLVFAINNHDRFSNPATNEYDVWLDTTRDGVEDYIVFAADSGAYRSGTFDGVTEVFIYEIASGACTPAVTWRWHRPTPARSCCPCRPRTWA